MIVHIEVKDRGEEELDTEQNGNEENRKRKEAQISYFSFFTERWANALGERVTGTRSMEQLVID